MFYRTSAYNETSITFWASDTRDVERYIDWMNSKRDINMVSAVEIGEEGHEDECAFSMDEPGWDDFMDEDAA